MSPAICRLFGYAALAGFVASLLVHMAALAGIDVLEHLPWIWVLHVGIFVALIPAFTKMTTSEDNEETADSVDALPFSPWVVKVALALFAYAIVNLVLAFLTGRDGAPWIEAGRYVLVQEERVVGTLSHAEYIRLRANEVRAFSGHWMLFYFLAVAAYLIRKNPTPD